MQPSYKQHLRPVDPLIKATNSLNMHVENVSSDDHKMKWIKLFFR